MEDKEGGDRKHIGGLEEAEMAEGKEERRERVPHRRSLRAKKPQMTRGRRRRSREGGDSVRESEEREGRRKEKISLQKPLAHDEARERGRDFSSLSPSRALSLLHMEAHAMK